MTRSLPPAHPELPQPTRSDESILFSFDLHLRSETKAERTRDIYLGAVKLLARWASAYRKVGLDELDRNDLKTYVVWMAETARKRNGEPYSQGYVNNQFRSLQAFFKWWAAEETVPNVMESMKPPRVDETLVPVVKDDEVDALLGRFEKQADHDSRRNYAILRLFLFSGVRLAELTAIKITDVDLTNGSVLVTGKGGKQRTAKFDVRTANALNRYIRARGKHKLSHLPNLWLGSNQRTPLTPNGIRQSVRKTAAAVGFHLHPHMFRHTFAHRYLSAGGAEGDLMELMGWKSPQMLRRYGASARSARAQRNYDKLDLFGGR